LKKSGSLEADSTSKRGVDARLEGKIVAIFALIFGCSPSVGVSADTKMFHDFCDSLLKGLREDMTCIFPEAIKSI